MKLKSMFLASMFLMSVACAFVAPGAQAQNEGEYTPTTSPQWWWKYVRTANLPSWSKGVVISSVFVDKEVVNPKTGDVTNTVVFTFTNRTAQTVECDGSVRVLHTIRDKNGIPINSEELLPARLPKALRPGESVLVRELALTPAKFRGNVEFLDVVER